MRKVERKPTPTADGIVWEDPPQHNGIPVDWSPIVAALKARPGVWARVDGPFGSSSTASGRAKSLRTFAGEDNVEARGGRVGGTPYLFARWILKAGSNGSVAQVCPDCGHEAETPAALRMHRRSCDGIPR